MSSTGRSKIPKKSRTALKRSEILHSFIRIVLKSIDPEKLVRRYIVLKRDVLSIGQAKYDLKNNRAVYVIGGGKASAAMALSLEEILGNRIVAGFVVTPYGYRAKAGRIRFYEAGHPVPDRAGLVAGRKMLKLIDRAGPKDLIIALWSGGASALLPAPVEGVSLDEEKRITRLLLKSGGTIREINAVRKHLSRIKGGQLGLTLFPRQVISLVLSDVKDDRLDVIASGPTVPDPTTYSEAIKILKRRKVWDEAPKRIKMHLNRGARGEVQETPKQKDPYFPHVRNLVVGNNHLAVVAAARQARKKGFHVLVLPGFIDGEAKKVAGRFVRLARKIHQTGGPVSKPACIIGGGETTVTVRGAGRGGRCQEFVLAAVEGIGGPKKTIMMAFGTDGADGMQPRGHRTAGCSVAGAFADDKTLSRARAMGLDPRVFLSRNDSYSFFKILGSQIVTGPTRTNVNDLYIMLVF